MSDENLQDLPLNTLVKMTSLFTKTFEAKSQLLAENLALQERLKEVEKDAARYRWLRSEDNDELVLLEANGKPVNPDTNSVFLPRADRLDAAIDRHLELIEKQLTVPDKYEQAFKAIRRTEVPGAFAVDPGRVTP